MSKFTTIPPDAITIPDEKTNYMKVYLEDNKLVLNLQFPQIPLKLDAKILPHLVDALIELQNR